MQIPSTFLVILEFMWRTRILKKKKKSHIAYKNKLTCVTVPVLSECNVTSYEEELYLNYTCMEYQAMQ